MKQLLLISAALCSLALAGCVHHHRGHPSVHGAKVVVPAPRVVVEKAPAKHCPPGQAKKGKC
jgi:hypothetical protein